MAHVNSDRLPPSPPLTPLRATPTLESRMPWFVSASRVMRYHAPMPMKDYLLLITTDTPGAPRIAFGVRVPMRDGVHLAADVYLPPLVSGEADRWPIILMRTPYLKSSETRA